MQSYEELKAYYRRNGEPSGQALRNKKHRDFVAAVKVATSFLDELESAGEIRMGLRIKCILDGVHTPPPCEACGEPVKGVRKETFNVYCSRRCMDAGAVDKRVQTNFERYGVKHAAQSAQFKEKAKATARERYGVDHYSKTDEFTSRVAETNLQRYGNACSLHGREQKEKTRRTRMERSSKPKEATQQGETLSSATVREKFRKTVRERYGVDNPMQSAEIRAKVEATNMARYGAPTTGGHPDVVAKRLATHRAKQVGDIQCQQHFTERQLELLNDGEALRQEYESYGSVIQLSEAIGIPPATVGRHLKRHGIEVDQHHRISKGEAEIVALVEGAGFEVITNTKRPLSPYEADIVVEEKKLIIEFNGVYWHSELYKDSTYHQMKSLMAHEAGYDIVHVWEDDWVNDRTRRIVEKKILAKLGQPQCARTYARKCTVAPVPVAVARAFYDATHIQGFVGSTYHLGLHLDGYLVACMSMKRLKDGVFDLTRYATSMTVVGGLSKLLAHFKRSVDWDEIITFASLDYSKGDLYEKTGFERVGVTPPNYWYTKGGAMRERRQKFMKGKLPSKLENFDATKTEVENMYEHGYFRVFDSGSIKYRMKR